MAYFRTVLVLVQVLSALANVGDIQSLEHSNVDTPDEGALGDDGDGDGDVDDYGGLKWRDCKTELWPLNEELGNVFGQMVEMLGRVTFKVDCHEVDAAEELIVGGYPRYGEKTHFNLRDNTAEFTEKNIIEYVRDPAHQWGVKLQEALKKVGIHSGDVFFGCTWATKEVFCYYRKQHVTESQLKEDLEERLRRLGLEQQSEEESMLKTDS